MFVSVSNNNNIIYIISCHGIINFAKLEVLIKCMSLSRQSSANE